MGIKRSWTDKYYIGAYDTNTRGEIKLSRLTGYIQETAWHHASHLGLGADFIYKENMVWMLAAIKIHIDYYPRWMDNIKITSWPRGIDRFFYLRDFVMVDNKGNRFGIASTQWLLLDIKSKRPKIFTNETILKVIENQKSVFDENIKKLPVIENGSDIIKSVDYTDMDLNHHLNSNRYIDLIIGSFDYKFVKENKITDLQLNYLKEVKEVPNIIISKYNIHDSLMFLLEGFSSDHKIKHFQSFTSFEPNIS